MNPNYSLLQQKVYDDYKDKSIEFLKEALETRKYVPHVLIIMEDILIERGAITRVKDEVVQDHLDAGNINDTGVLNTTESTLRKSKAEKNMISGALWCIGGTALTLANFGLIFWGAILFGGVQFIGGLISYYSTPKAE